MSQTVTTPRRRQFKMKPSTVLNLVLVLVIAIGLLIYYRPPSPIVPSVDMSSGMTNEPVAVATVLDVRADDMTRISFLRGDESFVLESDGELWSVVQPFADRADEVVTATLVENLAGIAFDEEILQPEADAAYGFDSPLIQAEFTLRDGSVASLLIGQPEDAVEYYVKTSASESVYLVRNLPERLFSVIAGEMIYGPLLDFTPAEVQKITAITEDGETKIIEREGTSWFSDTEYGRALVFDVDTFLRDLHAVNGSSIAATEETSRWEELGLTPVGKTLHVELELADGSTKILDVGHAAGDGRRYYVRSSDRPHAYIVVEFSAVNLSRKLAGATTDILRVNTARVTNVEVASTAENGSPVVHAFARSRENVHEWTSERRVAFYVPNLLESVNGVTTFRRAAEGTDESFGFVGNPDALSVKLTMENNATYVLDIGSVTADGNFVHVRSSSRDGVYLAAYDAVAEIREGLGLIRTDLLPINPDLLSGIEVASVAKDGSVTTNSLVKSGDTWTLNGGAANATNIETLVTRLRGLRADKLPAVVAEEQYKFYPAADSLRLTLRSTDGSELIFDIGTSVTEGTGWFTTTSYYVRVSDLEDVVFISERDHRDLNNAINAALR